MPMGTWKKHIFDRAGKRSVTPGKKKGPSCQADATKKYMARRSRSYKHELYGEWCRQMDALNGQKSGV